jgi:hypothetical protein
VPSSFLVLWEWRGSPTRPLARDEIQFGEIGSWHQCDPLPRRPVGSEVYASISPTLSTLGRFIAPLERASVTQGPLILVPSRVRPAPPLER